ncbi:type II toxin-antitoxin system PemK/MazF family toxin [Glaesserella parasuis]|nr:type II toxin-antitoxin system PemK/MazF family toxin [Glaesserella parasuis]MCT8768655.1 type II toxin-antitoxin system PemK/MazF family toxin [Glaesserella parasuis]MDE3963347.1 type II toxin-antitoxin system PemK/MazF family toxin [Glaesserella parasuis]
MALKYQPKEKAVVMCDFSGFIAPEMVKTRPVVVISKHKKNSELVTIVPLSTTKLEPLEPYHYPMPNNPLPDKSNIQCWAKCDMVYTVSLSRLDRYKLKKREYVVPVIDDEDFANIKKAVAKALKLS